MYWIVVLQCENVFMYQYIYQYTLENDQEKIIFFYMYSKVLSMWWSICAVHVFCWLVYVIVCIYTDASFHILLMFTWRRMFISINPESTYRIKWNRNFGTVHFLFWLFIHVLCDIIFHFLGLHVSVYTLYIFAYDVYLYYIYVY